MTFLADKDTVPNFINEAYLKLHWKRPIKRLDAFKLQLATKEWIKV